MRHRNSIYMLNDSSFFTHQDNRLVNNSSENKLTMQKSFLTLLTNYVYGEYGSINNEIKKKRIGKFDLHANFHVSDFRDNSIGVVRRGGGSVVGYEDYRNIIEKVNSNLSTRKGNMYNFLNQKNIKFECAQSRCESFELDNATKFWAAKLADQSLRAVLNTHPKSAERYSSLIEQAKHGDFSELIIPQENLLTKFGSTVLGNSLTPIFARVCKEKNWIS